MQKMAIIGIDFQNDFCVPNGTFNVPTGALLVDGAYDDAKRFAAWIKKNASKIDRCFVSIDSHFPVDIAHPAFWKDSHGKNPNPFTAISSSDIEKGIWTPSIPSLYKRVLDYTRTLEKGGKYPLLIWPEHCLIGSSGQALVPEFLDALNYWSKVNLATVDFITKGSNPYTEHYSAVKAEVPDPTDITTQLDLKLIKAIEDYDILVWAGEAGSHCVLSSFFDIVDNFGPDSVKKSVILTDCISPVKGFEKQQEDFLNKAKSMGVTLATTQTFLV